MLEKAPPDKNFKKARGGPARPPATLIFTGGLRHRADTYAALVEQLQGQQGATAVLVPQLVFDVDDLVPLHHDGLFPRSLMLRDFPVTDRAKTFFNSSAVSIVSFHYPYAPLHAFE